MSKAIAEALTLERQAYRTGYRHGWRPVPNNQLKTLSYPAEFAGHEDACCAYVRGFADAIADLVMMRHRATNKASK